MPKVFISHSSRDRRFVEQELIPLLSAHGLEYWYSTERIETAQQWRAAIYSGLEESDYFAVVLTPHATSSAWVEREVQWAVANRRGRVVPILLRKCDAATMLSELEAIQHVPYTGSVTVARRRFLATWKRRLRAAFVLRALGASVWLFLTGVYWRRRAVAIRVASTAVAICVLLMGAVLSAQDPIARSLASTVPGGYCRVEPFGSAVQVFERGWLVAKFEEGLFFAIREHGNGRITWQRFADTYKSGTPATCIGVEREHLLSRGFRKLYCQDAPYLARELGEPRSGEAKAYIQFQPWSAGLLIFGVPGTAIGMDGDEHKFTRLTGLFLASTAAHAGEGSAQGWTEGTSADNDRCSALWYRVVNGRESPLLAQRCGAGAAHATPLIKGQVACTRVAP